MDSDKPVSSVVVLIRMMSGLLDEIQLARCRLPWGRGNRRVGSEVDKELRFDDIVLGPGVAGFVGRGKGLEVRRWGAGVSEKVEDDADGDWRVDRCSVSRWTAEGVDGVSGSCCSITMRRYSKTRVYPIRSFIARSNL